MQSHNRLCPAETGHAEDEKAQSARVELMRREKNVIYEFKNKRGIMSLLEEQTMRIEFSTLNFYW